MKQTTYRCARIVLCREPPNLISVHAVRIQTLFADQKPDNWNRIVLCAYQKGMYFLRFVYDSHRDKS